MEGYLWKKGHHLPTMKRRYCVLKGTMLAYYSDKEEYMRKSIPRNVLEVVNIREWDGKTQFYHYKNGFEVDYLSGTTYQCHADSKEEKEQWIAAIQHGLEEPTRIAQEEIEDAQIQLQQETDKERQAMRAAADAVEAAQKHGQDVLTLDGCIKDCRDEQLKIEEHLQKSKLLYEEAQKSTRNTRHALEQAQHKAHDATLASIATGDEDSDDENENLRIPPKNDMDTMHVDDLMDRIARLAAQLEVDTTLEETLCKEIESLENRVEESSHRLEELQEKVRQSAEESKHMRQVATASLEKAQAAKKRTRLRISSWSGSSSHLDPLAEGYLLCKHPKKPSMHRRYYVLFGNTLCWYKDADSYTSQTNEPSGVVHVSGIMEWSGKVGGMKVFPHAFAIVTVEGKTLCCSAPMRQSALTWSTAVHIGLAMPPLSPHRAIAAKSRRDSFDLLSSMSSFSRRASFQAFAQPEDELDSPIAKTEKTETPAFQPTAVAAANIVLVEGYLVKKSSFVPVMKKKYCVLKGLHLHIFDSHEAYQENSATHDEIYVCSVSDWDGHGALLHYHHGFQIQTVRHQTVFCSAANSSEKTKWVNGIHEALLKHRDQLLSPTRREDKIIEDARQATLLEGIGQSDATHEMDEHVAAKEKFGAVLHEYYVKHNPRKLNDVPMLLEKYKEREKALISHLDRIYSTTLASDTDILALFDKLSTSKLNRRKSSGVTSGLTDFVKMTGYLTWNGEKSYCVLSVNKLVRYQTKALFETEPYNPVETVVISSVYEFPPPPQVDGNAISTGRNVFYLSCTRQANDDTRSTSPAVQQELVLEAGTTEETLKWMATIRSGLGFAHVHMEGHLASAENSKDMKSSARDIAPLRTKLIEYYRTHNPRKVGEVESLLSYFAGKEKQLLLDLDATYGTNIATDNGFIAALPQITTDLTTEIDVKSRDLTNVDKVHYESYLYVKHPTLDTTFSKYYCVLDGDIWSCYESSRDPYASDVEQTNTFSPNSNSSLHPNVPLFQDIVVNVHSQNTNLMDTQTFSLETKVNGLVLLRGDVDRLVHEWIHAFRMAVDAQRSRNDHELSTNEMDGPNRQLFNLLCSFYEKHNPDKVGEVRTLLNAFRGREQQLLVHIDSIYHSKISSNQTFTSLCAAIAGTQVLQNDEDSTVDQILMEGYLTKRGHLFPSMRKRYCVLVKNTLTYYTTHDDSRNESIKPLGSFQVEIVSDWHGKTSTQVYDHGMELETNDGKTFFCAAFSAKEKDDWLHAFKRGIAIIRAESGGGNDSVFEEVSSDDQSLAQRKEFRERLIQFYREYNPRKVTDLDLLLSCYARREFALLEAIDTAYGTRLFEDESLLSLLPRSNDHAHALQTLKYEGSLEKSADNTWKRLQSVYVVMDGLSITFYASREGYKAGTAIIAEQSFFLLAVKSLDIEQSSKESSRRSCRFAIETTNHVWIYLEAADPMQKRSWMQVLHAALDAILGQSLLEEGYLPDEATHQFNTVAIQGFLLVRVDYKSETDNTNKKGVPTPMEESFFVLQNTNELLMFNDTRDAAVAKFYALSTRAWNPSGTSWPVSGHVRNVCQFPFQIMTQEQIILSCNAATDVDRAKWIKQIRLGAEQASALAMLEEQLYEVKEEWKSKPTGHNDEPAIIAPRTITHNEYLEHEQIAKGYVDYRLGTNKKLPRECFAVLTFRGEVGLFDDESSYYKQGRPIFSSQALDMIDGPSAISSPISSPSGMGRLQKLFGEGKDLNLLSFSIKVRDNHVNVIHFFARSHTERERWISAFNSAINLFKGEVLLADEKIIMELEENEKHRVVQESETDEEITSFVVPTAAIEGLLTPMSDSFGFLRFAKSSPPTPLYGVLIGCRLRCFPSREAAASNLSSSEDNQSTVTTTFDVEITGLSDWQVPNSGTKPTGEQAMETDGTGFQVEVIRSTAPLTKEKLYLSASSVSMKHKWMHAIQHELDFIMAEKYLDEDAKSFARQVAEHVASSGATADSIRQRMEGYVRIRHHYVGAIWRERYIVLEATCLSIYSDRSDTLGDSHTRKALEKHDVIGIEKWHSTFSSNRRNRYGFRVENEAGGFLECSVTTEDEQSRWITTITSAVDEVSSHLSTKSMIRDPGLPFVPGASMEGYLKIKEKRKLMTFWKMRYCVIIGTEWLMYENQEQAAPISQEQSQVIPVAVYEVASVALWQRRSASSSRKFLREKVEDDMELISRAFTIGVTTGAEIDCKCQSSLERKRWMNAIEDEIHRALKEAQEVSQAMKQHEDTTAAQTAMRKKLQEVQSDAMRKSAWLKEAIESLDKEDEETDEDNDETEQQDTGNQLRQRSRSDYLDLSPESSPMRRKTRPDYVFDYMNSNLVEKPKPDGPTFSFPFSFFACMFPCFTRLERANNFNNGRMIAPMGVPGLLPTSDAWIQLYECDYYKDDGYKMDATF